MREFLFLKLELLQVQVATQKARVSRARVVALRNGFDAVAATMLLLSMTFALAHAHDPATLASPRAKAAPARELFVDATGSSGIRFKHVNGRNGEFCYPEIIGSGVAVFDYNNDGKLDILVLQGTALGAGGATASKEDCTAYLYRNDLVINQDGTRDLKYLQPSPEREKPPSTAQA
ncbi:MAG: enediyne biosynthesis protein [Gammaproteobacteria bacterium]|nr:enediyne biosynthesis protein [Gammaproteobacteria bacterium]